MATAATNYYCHKCLKFISPLTDFQCPDCHEAFIEERSSITDHPFRETRRTEFRNPFQGRRGTSIADGTIFLHGMNDDDHDEDEDNENDQRTNVFQTNTNVPLTYFLQQLFSHSMRGTNPSNPFVPQGNQRTMPMGLEDFLAQFLAQMGTNGNEGPAPATETQINSIPTTRIRPEQVRDRLQCSICMEDFQENDEAKVLSCSHHFHFQCISTWLRLHGTCPTCRVNINPTSSNDPFSSPRSTDHRRFPFH